MLIPLLKTEQNKWSYHSRFGPRSRSDTRYVKWTAKSNHYQILSGIPWQESNKTIFKGKYVLLHDHKVKPSTTWRYSCLVLSSWGRRKRKSSCLSKGNFDEICQNNLLGLATSQSDPGKLLNLAVVAFLWSGGSISHLRVKHLDTTTTKPPATPGRFLFPDISLKGNIRPLGNWEFPSSTWELWLIASDLFFFLSWTCNAFMTIKLFVCLNGSFKSLWEGPFGVLEEESQ